MAKKIIYITESQKKKIFEQEQFMLSEDKNSDYLKKLIKTYSSEMIKPYLETKVSELPNEYKNHFQQADGRLFDSCVQNNANLLMFLRLQFLKHFDISHGKGPIEFIPGLGRIGIAELGFFNEYANQSDISLLKQLVLFIHTNKDLFDTEINSDLNGWNFSQLKEHVNQKRKEFNLKNREKLSNSYNQGQSRYTVVPINSQEEARKYAPYTTWCVTDNAYSSYAHDGARFYFCLRDGFENVKKEVGEGCPLDEYGLSMVSVLVDMEGEPTYVTTRWNHQYDGENNENFRTAEQVQNILGINFYQTFKPYTREELHEMGIVLFDEVQELLDSGKKPEEIFDGFGVLYDGLAWVRLNEKYNYVSTDGKLISDMWFDWADDCYNGFARVELKGKFNFINTEGKLVSDTWFNSIWDFNNGFSKVELNRKWNFINTEGKIISDTWFDWVGDFYNGFGKVKLKGKFNFINTEGKLVSDTWFDGADYFHNGFVKVELNRKWNFINTEGKFIGDTWFDAAWNFENGFASVKLNEKFNYINTKGKLIGDTWFDVAHNFFENGLAMVKLKGKYNFINNEGKLISDTWFDWVDDFYNGFAKVGLNRKRYYLDKDGNLYDYSTKELVKKATLQESHKTLYITEAQLSEIKKKHKKKSKPSAMDQVHNKVNAGIMDAVTCGGMMEETILSENSNDKMVNAYIKQLFGIDNFQEVRNKVMDAYKKVPMARSYGDKFLLGVLRYIYEEKIQPKEYPILNYMISQMPYSFRNSFDGNFNGIPYAELKEKLFPKYAETIEPKTDCPKVRQTKNGYIIRRIDSFTEMHYYDAGGNWCIGNQEDMWYELIQYETVYIVENPSLVKKVDAERDKYEEKWDEASEYDEPGIDFPRQFRDDYALSRFVVISSEKGIFEVYSRYNIPNCHDGSFLSDKELEKLLGIPVREAFPYIPSEEKVETEKEMNEGAEPEADKYHIAGEGGNNEYFHAVNESPDTVGFFGKHFRDADALAFIKLKCDGKLHFANQNGIRHIDIINELEKRGEIEHIDFDELPYSEFAYEVETGRYWQAANVISCWGMPTTKQEISEFSNLIYDIEDYLRKKIDRKTLYVDMWKRRNGGTCVIPYSWLFNGVWEMLRTEVMSVIPKTEDKNAFLVRKLDRSEFIMYRNGDMLSTDEYKEKVLQSDRVALAEGLSSKGYDFEKDMKSILDFMREEGLNVYPYPKVKLDWEEQDGLFIRTGYYEPETKTVVVFCKDRHPKDILRSAAHEFIHHTQNLDGKDLNFSANDDVKDNERLEEIEAEAYLKGNIYFRKWTEHKHNKEMLQEGKKVVNDKGKIVPEKCDKCGGDVVVQIHGEPVYICKDCGKYFGTMPFPENLNEELETEITSDEVDLSSFNIKHHLNPKFWKDGHLDSRIRLKLLDVSDDFIESLSVDWAKPKDVIITGSIANFNWSKEYSDIDLHVLYDFSDIDENVEFVKEYFDSKKKIWNEEHKDLNVYGFPVEVYVQDANEKHASSGVYSLDKNEWIIEPERERLANAKVNKEYIREKVAKYVNLIDLLNEKFEEAGGDEYKTRKVREKAEKLFKAIKAERTKEFDRGKGEISNGNIIFKTLRRMDYIGILLDIKRRCYDTLNSL